LSNVEGTKLHKLWNGRDVRIRRSNHHVAMPLAQYRRGGRAVIKMRSIYNETYDLDCPTFISAVFWAVHCL